MAQKAGPPDEALGAAVLFHEDLVGGRWVLEKTRYLYYTGQVRRWLASASSSPLSADVGRIDALEARKRALTEAVELLTQRLRETGDAHDAVMATPHGGALVFWRSQSPAGRGMALVLSGSFVTASILANALALAAPLGVNLAAATRVGDIAFRPPLATAGDAGTMGISQDVEISRIAWRLQAWPRDVEALRRDQRRSQSLYMSMLALMVVSLGFGVATSVRTLRKQLEIARLKSDFASAVSHEFRSPLTGIRQLAEMLKTGRVASDQRKTEYYSMILEEVDRLSSMVENVLGFARLRDRSCATAFDATDMTAWLADVIERFRRSPAATNATIMASIPDGLPRLAIDREALARAVGNLVENAIKYSPGSRTAWVEADAAGGGVVIRVRDEGIGIDDADRPRLFERFYRGHGEHVQAVAGSGLGLSLVKEVVTAHGGHVAMESEPGKGTTFTIRLAGTP
jgi:signal transduction histidine kinase